MVGDGEVAVLMPFPTVQTGQIADASISESKLTAEVRERLNRVAGETITFTRILAEPLSAWTCVRADATGKLVRCTNAAEHQQAFLGLLMQAGLTDDPVMILAQGRALDTSFSRFAIGDVVFIGNDGTLTNQKPFSGYMQIVGSVMANNELVVMPAMAILLQ